jgi:hypothetical protein
MAGKGEGGKGVDPRQRGGWEGADPRQRAGREGGENEVGW